VARELALIYPFSGVALYVVGAILGHKDTRSTKRYSHLDTALLTSAVALIGKKSPHNPLAQASLIPCRCQQRGAPNDKKPLSESIT